MKRIGHLPQRQSTSISSNRIGSTIFLESDGFKGGGINPATGNYPPGEIINIDDAILTTNDEYISVGNNLYLSFISPPTITDAILTTDNEYISVGNDFYLSFVSEQVISNAVLTTDNEYLSVGDGFYLSFVSQNITDAVLTTDNEYLSVDTNSYLKF